MKEQTNESRTEGKRKNVVNNPGFECEPESLLPTLLCAVCDFFFAPRAKVRATSKNFPMGQIHPVANHIFYHPDAKHATWRLPNEKIKAGKKGKKKKLFLFTHATKT